MTKQVLRIIAAVLGTSFAMMAWSEFVFFNEEPAEKLLEALKQGALPFLNFVGEIVLFYAVPGSFLVALVGLFGSYGLGRVMLIGALTGYSIEGALVPAVYEAVPISFLWTSIAWHGPVTVGLGVFFLPRLLGDASMVKVIGVSLTLGGMWALWTTWTWGTDSSTPVPSLEFQLYAAATTAVFLCGYGLCYLAGWPRIKIPRWACIVLSLPTLLLLLAQGLHVPVSAAFLMLIVVGMMSALRLWGPADEAGYRIRWINVAVLVLMPLAAGLIHGMLLETGAPIAAEDLVFLVFSTGLITWVYGVTKEILVHRRANRT